MSLVLIDTSLWIEFFSKNPRISPHLLLQLSHVIAEGEAALIEPVRAELLSGHIIPKVRDEIEKAFDALDMIDRDWGSRDIWEEIISLADTAKSKRLPIPGIVDRMIVLSALHAQATVASLDKGLIKLAQAIGISIFR